MADPLNIFGLDDIQKATGREIRQVVATRTDIQKAIDRYYGMSQTIEAAAMDFAGEKGAAVAKLAEMPGAAAEDAPVVKLVSMLIAQAIMDRASDIHIDPEGESHQNTLPDRWRAHRGEDPAPRDACADRLPHQDHGEHGYRGKARAAGRTVPGQSHAQRHAGRS